MKFNHEKFIRDFKAWFLKEFKTPFSNPRSDNLDKILFFIEADSEWTDIRHVAYFLSTIGHETGWRFEPVREGHAKPGTSVYKIQERYWPSGYYGRGLIQLTWEKNYRKFQNLLGIPLVKNPDLALVPSTSYIIASKGMRNGLFTGKDLDDYINNSKTDYLNARQIVNILDKAQEISIYAQNIEKLLRLSLETEGGRDVNEESLETPVVEEIIPQEPEISQDVKPVVINKPENANPIIVSQPKDDSILVTPVPPQETSGWKTWLTTATGILTSLGISAASFGSWMGGVIKDPSTNKFALILGIGTLASGILFAITYLIIRTAIVLRREKQAHEKTLLEMQIKADPHRYNVEVEK